MANHNTQPTRNWVNKRLTDAFLGGLDLQVEYRAAGGKRSSRRVIPIRLAQPENDSILVYCKDAHGIRSLKISGLRSMEPVAIEDANA